MSRHKLIFHDDVLDSKLEHELLRNPPYELTLTIEELTKPSDKKRCKKDSLELKVPRPPNGYILYRKDFGAKIKLTQPNLKVQDISKMSSEHWKKEDSMVKLFFKILAEIQGENHNKQYPGYKYNPRSDRRNGKRCRSKSKRKVNRDAPLPNANTTTNLPNFEQPSEITSPLSNLMYQCVTEVDSTVNTQYNPSFSDPFPLTSKTPIDSAFNGSLPFIFDPSTYGFYPNLIIDDTDVVQAQSTFNPVEVSNTRNETFYGPIDVCPDSNLNTNPVYFDSLQYAFSTPCTFETDISCNFDLHGSDWPVNN
ncbi:10813_t:CDS:1 [Acaulospora morrowiae]|uniref:10813_t:CDS:1 n=1 Tax=Acaulospora morrowiae TaxID=94023 RepID=A0A9N9G2P3_9GLOM|nr:10813_t:CDS:1 [Acaulospora morrowiae]